MPIETIDKEFYNLKIYKNNFLELIIKDNCNVDEKFGYEIKELLEKLRPGTKFYLLAEGEGFFLASKQFRKLMTTQEYTSHLKACAFFSSNAPLNLLHITYNEIDKPVVPVKIFNLKQDAVAWLDVQMHLD